MLIDTAKKQGLGRVSLRVERFALLLDPWYKQRSKEVFQNRGQVLGVECVAETNGAVAETFGCVTKSEPAEQPPVSCPIDDTAHPRPASKKFKQSELYYLHPVSRLWAAAGGESCAGNEATCSDM